MAAAALETQSAFKKAFRQTSVRSFWASNSVSKGSKDQFAVCKAADALN